MTEETLFAAALERNTPAERAAFLDEACSGDAPLRQRVEALLRSHEQADFLKTPAVQRAAQMVGRAASGEITEAETRGEDPSPSLDFLAPSEKPDALGRLGHYEILEVIGRGGMGIVLRAFDEKLHRVVAIKVMAAQLATNAAARRRFTREAQAQAAVSHDHVVAVHAVEETNGLPYLVMQFISGMSLQERLDQSGPLQLAEIVRIGMQTAAGLAAAHAQGLVHRDIKPANILLENGIERVKITDFGLARAADDASLSQSGALAGTPMYMAPEQAEGGTLDHRADLFSLGSAMYVMATGRPPFRASTTAGVLKRVVEDAPRSIQESNPEAPVWLIAIIARLHAKDPADRFQSASEVAELLSKHLAHLQQPAQVPLPAVCPSRSPPLRRGARGRRLRWAAVLLFLVVGLSLTEATGVTRLVPTMIRIFTPDGTLVVEVDDPGVKVTIEGDGGILITDAGPQEVRLRPGSYKVRATRDGKPVRPEELITITRGAKRVVKVSLEAVEARAKGVVQGAPGTFVVLNGKGVQVGKFSTLADAVSGASDGDTIEVCGNGPFVSEPIRITQPALTIRAGAGFRPVIKLSPQAVEAKARLLETHGALVVEGLEFQRLADNLQIVDPGARHLGERQFAWCALLQASKALHVANCRLVTRKTHSAILSDGAVCVVRNCELLCSECGFSVYMSPSTTVKSLVVDNCLVLGTHQSPARLAFWTLGAEESLVQLSRNTWRTDVASFWFLSWREPQDDPIAALGPRPTALKVKVLRVEASENVFDSGSVFYWHCGPNTIFSESLLANLVGWKGEGNVFAGGAPLLEVQRGYAAPEPVKGTQTLAAWRRLWGTAEDNSVRGVVRYQGGDLLAKVNLAPEQLTPADFRLRPDSAGYRAGKNDKDRGADVDLVGPGKAYERWRKTPEYQLWLKETRQLK
ncbi:MAG TPA: serine/threonine-protein kinase [Gemmataceae bacterium]|jgi:hypothetical protein